MIVKSSFTCSMQSVAYSAVATARSRFSSAIWERDCASALTRENIRAASPAGMMFPCPGQT